MQIKSIMPKPFNLVQVKQHPIAFKSNPFEEPLEDEDGIWGCGDGYSSAQRDLIRERIMYRSLLVRDFQEEKLAKTMYEKTSAQIEPPSDFMIKYFASIPAFVNSYRGQCLLSKPQQIKTLKDKGVERVIDLIENEDYEKKCKEAGLEYYGFKINDLFTHPALCEKEKYFNKHKAQITIDYCHEEDKIAQFKAVKENYYPEIRKFVDKFIGLVDKMNEGNFYISCEWGMRRTDYMLSMASHFNPKTKGEPCEVLYSKAPPYNAMKNLYENLTNEDKARLGFSKDFEINLINTIKENL